MLDICGVPGGLVMGASQANLLEQQLVEALEPICGSLPRVGAARARWEQRLRISSFAVESTASCPTKALASGESPFAESPAVAARAVAYSVLRTISKSGAAPLEAYESALDGADTDRFPWKWLFSPSTSQAARLATKERAIRLVGPIASMKEFPAVHVSEIGLRPLWRHTGRPVELQGRIDLLVRGDRRGGSDGGGGVDGGRDVALLVYEGVKRPQGRPLAAFEALTAVLSQRAYPDAIVFVHPIEGRRYTVEVTNDLLVSGITAAVDAVVAAIGARGHRQRGSGPARLADAVGLAGAAGLAGLDRRPGADCRWCPLGGRAPEGTQEACEEGARWLAGPARWPWWWTAGESPPVAVGSDSGGVVEREDG